MQNKGSGNNDELLKNLRAMFEKKDGDEDKRPVKKKGTDDAYDRELSSQLSDTMARAMKKSAPTQRPKKDSKGQGAGKPSVANAAKTSVKPQAKSENIVIAEESDKLADTPMHTEEAHTLETSDAPQIENTSSLEESEAPENINNTEDAFEAEISELNTDSDSDLLDLSYADEQEQLTLFDSEPDQSFDGIEDYIVPMPEPARVKSPAGLIADLMDDFGGDDAEDNGSSEYIEDTESDDDAFAASLAELDREDKSDGADDGVIQRRGFVSNDTDIENILQIPGADTYESVTAKKVEPVSKKRPQRLGKRKDNRRLRDKDISLAMRFGYEYELAERIGYDKVRDRVQRSDEIEVDPSRLKNTFGYCGREFSHLSDRDAVLARFSRSLRGLKVRTVLTSIIFLLVLAIENLSLFSGGKVDIPFVEAYPVSVNIASFALLMIAVFISAKPLFNGFKDALKFNCSEYSAVSFSVFFVIVYDIVSIAMFVSKGERYFMLNTVTLLGLLMTLVARCLDHRREYRAFCLMSDGEKKYCAEKYIPIVKNSAKRTENKFQSSFITAETDIVDGYFERTSRTSEWYKKQSFIIAPIFALSLLVFIISYLNGKELLLSYSYLVTSIALCMPISMVILNSVSFACASKDMNKKGCAVIGEQAADEYSQAYGMVFGEKAMLGASFNSIDRERSCGDEEMQSAVKYVCKLFSLIDSSVSETVISVLGGEDISNVKLKVEHIEPDGIEAFSAENHRILLGEREYMLRHRIDIKPAGVRVNSEDVFKKTLGSLYVAVDDLICWKLVLDYEAKKEFIKAAEILMSEGVCTGVETVNPNINEDFLLKHRFPTSVSTVTSDRFAVNEADTEKSADNKSSDASASVSKNSGIIAKHECDMIYPLLWCKHIKHNQRVGMGVTFAMMAVSLAVLSFSAIFGLHTSLSSAMLTLISLITNVIAMLSGLFNTPIQSIDTVQEQNTEIQENDKVKDKNDRKQ